MVGLRLSWRFMFVAGFLKCPSLYRFFVQNKLSMQLQCVESGCVLFRLLDQATQKRRASESYC